MGRRLGCILIPLFFLVGGIIIWFVFIEPIRLHSRFCQNVRTELESLAKRRPAELSKKQWQHVVGLTLNAHANCFVIQKDLPVEEMERFEAGLRSRLKGTVDLAIIDWIWDEIVRLTRNGKSYSESYRPTSPAKLAEFEASNESWIEIKVN
jgi:hypothetical protein